MEISKEAAALGGLIFYGETEIGNLGNFLGRGSDNGKLMQLLGLLALCLSICGYFACLAAAYRAALRLQIGTSALTDAQVPTAWWTEGLQWVGACVLAYAVAFSLRAVRNRGLRLAITLTLAALTAGWLAAQHHAYSLDVFRYLWDGRLLLHGVDPYRYVPSDPHLNAFQNWIYWRALAWRDWPEAYPPVAQVYFAVLSYLASGRVQIYKWLLVLNQIASITLFARALYIRRLQESEGSTRESLSHANTPLGGRASSGGFLRILQDVDIRRIALFGLFPPLVVEALGASHVDQFAVPWLLLAWLCWLRGRFGWLGVALAVATAIKLYPIVLLAAFYRRGQLRQALVMVLAFGLTLCAVYAPFAVSDHHIFRFFGRAAQEMSYNGSVQYILATYLGNVASAGHLSTVVLALFVMATWVVVLFTPAYRLSVERKVCLIGLGLLLGSPVVHPWYVTFLLPFAISVDELSVIWLSITIHFTYDQIPHNRFIEYIPTYALWLRGLTKSRASIR